MSQAIFPRRQNAHCGKEMSAHKPMCLGWGAGADLLVDKDLILMESKSKIMEESLDFVLSAMGSCLEV